MGNRNGFLLAIDSCGSVGGAALGRVEAEEVVVLETAALAGKTYSAQLLPAIAGLLERASVTVAHLVALVVVHGPGSFTGVRVGISAVKGLAEAAGLPVIALSRLQVLAHAAGVSAVALLNAGRGEVYAGIYRDGVREREALLSPSEAVQVIREAGLPAIICEDDVEALLAAQDLPPEILRVPEPAPSDALRLGAVRLRAGSFDDIATLDGNYLRRSDAELFGKAKAHGHAGAPALESAS